MTGPFRKTGVFIAVLTLILNGASQIPPGSLEITAPQTIILGQTYALKCTVTGGNPAPTVKWLRDNQIDRQIIDDTITSSGNTYINEYEFTASADEHLKVFECQSENGVLQNPLSKTIFVEVYRPPNTPVLSGPKSVLSGKSTVWTCTSSGAYPAQTMRMRIEGTEFTSQFAPNIVFKPVDKSYTVTGTLTWAPFMANNGQTLYCDVYHPKTRGANNPQTVSLPLTVQSTLAVQAPNLNYAATVGQPLTIVCQVIAGRATAITWHKNNQQIVLSSDTRLSGSTPNTPSLTISQVQTNDAGSYQCRATGGTTTVITNVITVTVYVPLAITAPRTSYTPTVGQQVILACQVTFGTATSITWYKNSQQITLANDVRLSGSSPGNPSLTINQVRTGDAGTYTCHGTVGTTTVQTGPITVSVNSTDTIPRLTIGSTQYFVTVGDSVQLNCTVSSTMSIETVYWKIEMTKWSKFVNSTTDIAKYSGSTQSNPTLVVIDTKTDDAGYYTCFASNSVATGESQRSKLNVITADESNSKLYIIIGVLAGCVLVCVIICTVLVYRRKGFINVMKASSPDRNELPRHQIEMLRYQNAGQTTQNRIHVNDRPSDDLNPEMKEHHVYNRTVDDDTDQYMTMTLPSKTDQYMTMTLPSNTYQNMTMTLPSNTDQ